jgi:hypothetical protein
MSRNDIAGRIRRSHLMSRVVILRHVYKKPFVVCDADETMFVKVEGM